MNKLVVYYIVDRWSHCYINVQEDGEYPIYLYVDRAYKADSGEIPTTVYCGYSNSRKKFRVDLPLRQVFVLCEQLREGLLRGSIHFDDRS